MFDALRARRCYAVSGDRIALDFELNGAMMGSELPYARERRMRVAVRGWDQVDRVEILKNNRVIHRDFRWIANPAASWRRPVLVRRVRLGPWPALGWGGTADWDFQLNVEGGRFRSSALLHLRPAR
ncbi:MAG: hypothetical protein R2724_01315 [Bryobacterales bacterium]